MKVVIMAGGRGTRIAELFPDIPKPLIPVDGMPILEREIRLLASQGFKDLILTVGYLANKIIAYFGLIYIMFSCPKFIRNVCGCNMIMNLSTINF